MGELDDLNSGLANIEAATSWREAAEGSQQVAFAQKTMIDALVAALEAVEWAGNSRGKPMCPECRALKSQGHKIRDCSTDAALRLARGENE